MKRTADLSPCGAFRFVLSRQWSDMPRCAWLMLNPSTADASQDDPTIRRCMKFADAWGYGAIDVVNVFPFRTSQPAELWRWAFSGAYADASDAMQHNADRIRDVAAEAALRVVAFGADVAGRAESTLLATLDDYRDGVVCLGTNAAGWPLHPMARGKQRVPDNTAPRFWTRPSVGEG